MYKKMIVMDLDCTLLNNEKKVSDRTKECLLDLKKKGYLTVIATGRVLDSAIEVTDGACFANYIISNDGGLIYGKDNDKIIFKNVIDKKIVSNICSLYDSNTSYIDICDLHYYNKYTNNEYVNGGFSKKIDDIDSFIKAVDVVNMGIKLKNSDDINKLVADLNDCYSDIKSYVMYDSHNLNNKWIEISGINISKFNAIKMIAEIEGVDIQDIITFGDSTNDIDMIKNSGVGVAMGNAIEDVKKVSKYITTSNNEDGVFEFLKQYLVGEI